MDDMAFIINDGDDDYFYFVKNHGVYGRNIKHPAGAADADSFGRRLVTGAGRENNRRFVCPDDSNISLYRKGFCALAHIQRPCYNAIATGTARLRL